MTKSTFILLLKALSILAILIVYKHAEARAVTEKPTISQSDVQWICRYNIGPNKKLTPATMKACKTYGEKVLLKYAQTKAAMANGPSAAEVANFLTHMNARPTRTIAGDQ